MEVMGDVKCYHCGHISGQVVGRRGAPVGSRPGRLALHTFKPREGFSGDPPAPGERLRCERCRGPVYLEDLRPVLVEPVITLAAKSKRKTRAA
jgi:hypothetical protein